MSFFRFMDNPLAVTKRSDGALKTYGSVSDYRAWTNDKAEQSKFIHDIVKRKSGKAASEDNDNETPQGIAAAVQNIDTMSKNDLVHQIKSLQNELKTKDVELDKIHSLFKTTSRKLSEMERIIKDKHSFENQLQESHAQLQNLKGEQKRKDEQLRQMKQEMDELRCQSTASVETEEAWNKIKNKAEMLEDVKKERNMLKSQLCKMVGISDVLMKLKSRADEADGLEQEISRLQRELQRCGQGAAGDNLPKKRVASACKQCNKTLEDFCRLQAILESEQNKNVETEAERNFLRERCRAIDVIEAESILYKTKYEEAECKISKLKEMLIRSDGSEHQVREMQQRLATKESQLKESERHAAELINIVERLEMDLKEREVYIESITRRKQQEFEANSVKTIVSTTDKDFVPTGTVKSIVQQLTIETIPTNCKCGIDNCQCLNVSKRIPGTSKSLSLQSPVSSKGSLDKGNARINNLEPIPLECCPCNVAAPQETVEMYSECDRLQRELSCEEVRLLRTQNAALDAELKRLKCEMEEMVKVMNQVDEQRKSNTCLEGELTQMNCAVSQEFTTKESLYISSIADKENELCKLRLVFEDLQNKFCDERERSKRLEKSLEVACKELQELRPLENIRECCKALEEKLSLAETNGEERSKKVQELQGNCDKVCEENKCMKKQIAELQIDRDEQRKYAKKLADQLCQRRSMKEKIEPQENADNRETLRQCIKDLRQHYDALRVEKMELIQCYEKKLMAMETDIKNLKFDRNESLKSCRQCDCSSSVECDDRLLQKAMKCGLNSLQREELIDLHNRVRCAMVKLRESPRLDLKTPFDCYTKKADEIRFKYNLSFPSMMDTDDIPVKDFDLSSSKTMPPLLRSSSRKSSKGAQTKPRARSSDAETDKLSRCVTFSKQKTR